MESWRDVLIASAGGLAIQLPVFLVYLAGVIMSLVYWRRCRAASLLTLCGSVLLIVTALAGTVAAHYAVLAGRGTGWSPEKIGMLANLQAVIRNILAAAGLALIVTAVFFRRRS